MCEMKREKRLTEPGEQTTFDDTEGAVQAQLPGEDARIRWKGPGPSPSAGGGREGQPRSLEPEPQRHGAYFLGKPVGSGVLFSAWC